MNIKQTIPIILVTILLTITNSWSQEKFPGFKNLQSNESQAKYILKKLKKYWQGEKNYPQRQVKIIYFYGRDGKPHKNYQQRIDAIMADFQKFYKTEFSKNNYESRCLNLEYNPDQTLKIHKVKGILKSSYYNYKSGWQILQEIKPKLQKQNINIDKETLLIFCGLTKTVKVTDNKYNINIYSPFYGLSTANHTQGSCFIADSELFEPKNFANTTTKVLVKEHNKSRTVSLGELNTIYLGGAIHELGHGLGLPHNKEHEDLHKTRGTALMGSGNYTYRKNLRNPQNKGTFLTHASCMRLISHPTFSRCTRDMNKKAKCTITNLTSSFTNKKLIIKGKLTTNIPAYGIIAYNDPKGHNDYDAKTWCSVVNNKGEFEIYIKEIIPAQYDLRIVICHINGATTTYKYKYSMNKNRMLENINFAKQK